VNGSAKEHVYDLLRGRIASGTYPGGTWLREEEIATGAGVSRTPVREALHRLDAEGLVQLVRHRGALVIGWTAADLDDLFDLRIVLEGYSARRAAERRTDAQVIELRAQCDLMDERLPNADEVGLQQLATLSADFHAAVGRAAGNRQLVALIPTIVAQPFVSEAFHHHTRSDLEHSFDHHREIVAAIEARDGDWAEAIMRAHLRHGRHSLHRMESRPGPL